MWAWLAILVNHLDWLIIGGRLGVPYPDAYSQANRVRIVEPHPKPGEEPAAAAVRTVREILDTASWWGVLTGLAVKLGQALQLVAYVWGTAVLLSGLVANLNDYDFWTVAMLALIGGMLLMYLRSTHQLFQQWISGRLHDGFSGHVLPLHGHEWRRGWWLHYFSRRGAVILCLINVGLSGWRLWAIQVKLAGDVSRTDASLICFYALLLASSCCILSGKTCMRFFYGDTYLLYHTDYLCGVVVDVGQFLPGLPAATGLEQRMIKFHFEHVFHITVHDGVWQGMVFATPLGFLLQEYYFGWQSNLQPLNDTYSQRLRDLIQVFSQHGSRVEQLLIERWKRGLYDSTVMLVSKNQRPGQEFIGPLNPWDDYI